MAVLPPHKQRPVLAHSHHGSRAVMMDKIPVVFMAVRQDPVLINGEDYALISLFPVQELYRGHLFLLIFHMIPVLFAVPSEPFFYCFFAFFCCLAISTHFSKQASEALMMALRSPYSSSTATA